MAWLLSAGNHQSFLVATLIITRFSQSTVDIMVHWWHFLSHSSRHSEVSLDFVIDGTFKVSKVSGLPAQAVIAYDCQVKITDFLDRDSEGEDAVDEQEFDFSPEKGNVAFASAHDGWAFQIRQFANLYAEKMGVKAEKLEPIMWGDWTYDSKSKRAVKLKKGSKAKPLFVQVCSCFLV